MQKICHYIDFNIANMQIKYAQYATKYAKNMQKNMQNMHKSMYLHILHIYALPTLLMKWSKFYLSLSGGIGSQSLLPVTLALASTKFTKREPFISLLILLEPFKVVIVLNHFKFKATI